MLKRIPFAEHSTIWQGLQACYSLQDKTGTNVRSIYRTREGTSTTGLNNLTNNNGKLRNCFNFDGHNTEYIDLTGKLEQVVGEFFEVGKEFTISGWIKPNVLSGTKINFGSTANLTQRGFYISTEDSKLAITLVDSAGNIDILKTTADVCSSGVWVHYTLVYGGGAIDTDWVFYIDGLSEAWTVTTSTGAVTSITSAAKNCYMGSTDSYKHFAGSDEQVIVWNRELIASEALWVAEGHVSDQSWKQVT